MNQAVFIASLSHSGSTLLALILGGHSRLVGLGEIARVLKPGPMGLEKTRKVLCSCNQDMDHCVFWGKVSTALSGKEDATVEEKYALVFDTCKTVFGSDFIPVDSSKYLPPLRTVHRQLNVELKVLFLIKDVRAYTISQMERATRNNAPYRQRTAAYHFLDWYKSNRKVKDYLITNNISHLQIGYEELCLSPTQTIEKICGFLGEGYEPSMLSLTDSGSHVIRGNRMRSQSGKRQRITYDHRWFYRKEWMLWSMLFPKIMKFNAKVYQNGTARNWDQ